jgi:hypothetical protein
MTGRANKNRRRKKSNSSIPLPLIPSRQGRGKFLKGMNCINEFNSNRKSLIKSLLTSLCQREGLFPSLEKRGEGRFSNL